MSAEQRRGTRSPERSEPEVAWLEHASEPRRSNDIRKVFDRASSVSTTSITLTGYLTIAARDDPFWCVHPRWELTGLVGSNT